MRTIGYYCSTNILPPGALERVKVKLMPSQMQTTDAILEQLRPYIDTFSRDMHETVDGLSEYVEHVAVKINDSRATAWKEFIDEVLPQTAVMVDTFNNIAPVEQIQLHLIEEARSREILVISKEQSAIAKLDPALAFELQQQWIIDPLKKSIGEQQGEREINYQKLLGLMRKNMTVERIAAELGQSKSTIFRWRKQYEERLKLDLPGFEIRD
jgi:hypothetical protein